MTQATSIDDTVQDREIRPGDEQRLQSPPSSPQTSGKLEQYAELGSEVKSDLDKLRLEDPEAYIILKQGDTNIIDAQTNLFSKYFFENELVPHMMEKARNEGTTISYIKLDIDDFHDFNEQYKHAAGDAGIEYVVDKMNNNLRTGDNLDKKEGEELREPRNKDLRGARVGYGEEFGILLYGVNEDQAWIVAERLRHAINNDTIKTKDGRELYVTASFGVAEMKPEEPACDLLQRADDALYKAKELGKNMVLPYSKIPQNKPELGKPETEKITLKEAA